MNGQSPSDSERCRQRPKNWPEFGVEDIAAVSRVLASGKVNYWTGQECRLFEKEYAARLGTKHAIALTNGTVALELALYALGIGPGDEVIVTPRSFVASASCIVMRGARPVFADVDRDSQSVTAATIEPKISARTKAIIAVHLAGWPCDMGPIMDLAASRGLKVVEDCAQAHGAAYDGRPVGSIGDINAFSFCQDKIMTTGGEGGLVTTSDEELWRAAWAFKDHGKSYSAVYEREHPPGFRWLHESFGTNWRMLEVQGALGRRCLLHLDGWVETRRRNAAILTSMFGETPGLRVTIPPANVNHSYYKYYVFVDPTALRSGWSRDRVMNSITERGVPCYSGSCSEMYLERAFSSSEYRVGERLPVARELGATSLMFLVHPTLSDDDMQQTGEVVAAVMKEAVR